MADRLKVDFQAPGPLSGGDLVVFVGDDLKPTPAVARADRREGGRAHRARGADRALQGQGAVRDDARRAGGAGGRPPDRRRHRRREDRARSISSSSAASSPASIAGKARRRSSPICRASSSGRRPRPISRSGRACAATASTATRPQEGRRRSDEAGKQLVFGVADPAAAPPRRQARDGLAAGVILARDLVNEPPNVLGPVEFAKRVEGLSRSSASRSRSSTSRRCARSACARCSASGRARERESRVVIMRWNGGRPGGQARRLHRQGRGVRFRRHLDQARRRHGGHEGRHGGRRLRRRPDARAGEPQGQGQRRSARSASSRTCRTATRSAPATSSRRCPARPSRSSTPTRRAGSSSRTCSGTCRTASSRNS